MRSCYELTLPKHILGQVLGHPFFSDRPICGPYDPYVAPNVGLKGLPLYPSSGVRQIAMSPYTGNGKNDMAPWQGKTHGKNKDSQMFPVEMIPIDPLDELPVEHSCYGAQDGLGVSRTEGTADLLSALFGTSGE